ncbi:MAG: hypothetical protein ABFE13_21870 [Phycisphaerales bacterium]
MEMMKRVAMAAVSLTLAVVARGSQPRESTEPSNTRQMRCVVKAAADIDVIPMSFDLVESLLRSDAVAGKAARQVWPAGHAVHDAFFDVRPLGDSGLQGEPANDIAPPETRVVLFELQIHVSSDVAPAAKEFGDVLIENLRAELLEAFAAHRAALKTQLAEAETQRDTICKELDDLLTQSRPIETELIRPDPADEAVYEQFERVVVLSAMTLTTPLAEAFEILSRSVEPPLRIVVLWRDVYENANLEPSTAVDMDGLANMPLGTALDCLLDAISDPLYPENPVEFAMDRGVIVVATRAGLPKKKMETRMYDLPPLLQAGNRVLDVADLIRETIAPQSWLDFHPGAGEGTIVSSAGGRLVVSQSRDIHIRIQELLGQLATEPSISLPAETSHRTLAERMESLMSYRNQLENELDRLQERLAQISRDKQDKSRQAAKETLRSTANDLYQAVAELEGIRNRLGNASESQKLEQVLARVSQSMNRCNQVTRENGPPLDTGLPWRKGSEEETIVLRIAGKQRDLREVSRRIAETQRAMAGSETVAPLLSRVQWTAGRYDQAIAQVNLLEDRIASLRPCTVAVLGGTN